MLLSVTTAALLVSGCASIVKDVHLYYQQMAVNYKEAAEKAKLDAVILERNSGTLLQNGDPHKYNRSQRELARLKNWQEYCLKQSERFQKAADNTVGPGETRPDADPEVKAPPPVVETP